MAGVGSVAEDLPSVGKALGANPSIRRRKRKKKQDSKIMYDRAASSRSL